MLSANAIQYESEEKVNMIGINIFTSHSQPHQEYLATFKYKLSGKANENDFTENFV